LVKWVNRRLVLALFLLSLMVSGVMFVAVQPIKAAYRTITVPDDYTSIQQAINRADEGDTVLVNSGTYREHVVVNKTLSLLSFEGAVIDASGDPGDSLKPDIARWIGITILSNCSTVKGFNIRNAANYGIEVRTDYCVVQNNVLEECTVSGVRVSASHNLICNNTVRFCHIGVMLGDACGNSVNSNIIEQSRYSGIYLFSYSSDNTITNNVVSQTTHTQYGEGGYGINVGTAAHNNLFFQNTIRNNSNIGCDIDLFGQGYPYPYANVVYHNNLVGNKIQAYDTGENNVWNLDYPLGGNFWSDYNGVDAKSGPDQSINGSDGIGDTPHMIDSTHKDKYPLISPYTQTDSSTRQVNFADSFKDHDGAPLYVKPSSFILVFPNGTISSPLEIGTYLIQSGTTVMRSVVWQGTDVTPDTIVTFDAADGNPTINCKIYNLTIAPVFYNVAENQSATGLNQTKTGNQTENVIPSSWSIRFPNGTAVTVSSSVTYTQTQTGYYSLFNVGLDGFNITSPEVGLSLTADTIWSPRIGLFKTVNNQTFMFDSNSTLTETGFDANEKVLSFTAAGPNGTNGYTNITFAESLTIKPKDIVVRQDGSQINYTLVHMDDAWLLAINYTHSTHNFDVDFGANADAIPEFPPSTVLTTLIIALILLTVLAAVFPKVQKKGRWLQ
jgi:nitrous oxidase accessory protein